MPRRVDPLSAEEIRLGGGVGPGRGHRQRRCHHPGHGAGRPPTAGRHACARTAGRRRAAAGRSGLPPAFPGRQHHTRPLMTASACRPAQGLAENRRPRPGHSQRRARGAEFRPAAFRRGHAHGAVSSTPSKARGRKSSTRARPRPAGGALRNTPWPAAADAIIASACSTWCSSRTTTWPRCGTQGPTPSPPPSSARARKFPAAQSRSRGRHAGQVRAGGRRRRRHHPARQHDAGAVAPGGEARAGPRQDRSQRRRESEHVRAIAETGVDFISVGALTHSARAVDIGLDFEATTDQR